MSDNGKDVAPAHPLDDCDPGECYRTMMSERTALITARRESEDNLIKTVIQLSAALMALLAGFISQAKIELSLPTFILFGSALGALAIAIISGLMEQRYASRAYLEQQTLVEDYFQKKIATFNDPPSNESVRIAQATAFISFVVALLCLGTFAVAEAGANYVKVKRSSVTSTSTTSAPGTNTSAVSPTVSSGAVQARKQVGSSVDATTTAPVSKEVIKEKASGEK